MSSVVEVILNEQKPWTIMSAWLLGYGSVVNNHVWIVRIVQIVRIDDLHNLWNDSYEP